MSTHKHIKILFFILCSCQISTICFSQKSIYISLFGNDNNDGTIDYPVKSIEKANSLVQKSKKTTTGNIYVYFRGGTYYLERPVIFDKTVSGNTGSSVIYSSYPGEKAIINGGKTIENWENYNEEIVKTNIGKINIRQLYINNQRAIRAREPNICLYNKIISYDPDSKSIKVNQNEIPELKFSNAELIIQKHWDIDILRISKVVSEDSLKKIFFKNPEITRTFTQTYPLKESNQTYHLENDLSFIDSSNEWCLDNKTGDLYFLPQTSHTFINQKIQIPVLEKLFIIRGTTDEPVRNITFRDLTFELTNWSAPSLLGYNGIQAGVINWSNAIQPTPSAIYAKDAVNLSLLDNQFRNLGGAGVLFFSGVKDSKIEGNVFNDISGNGIVIDNDIIGETHTTNKDPKTICENISVANNYITRIGQDYYGSVGIFVGYGSHIIIENNLIENLPYTGISVGWGWSLDSSPLSHNIIRNNIIKKPMTMMDDGAGIYLLSNQPETLVENNIITDIVKSKWAGSTEIFSIYLDEGSNHMTIQNNQFEDGNLGIFISPNAGENNIINNNLPDPVTDTTYEIGLTNAYSQIVQKARKYRSNSIADCNTQLEYNIVEKIKDFAIVPNPAQTRINIIFSFSFNEKDFSIEIITLQGKQVFNQDFTAKDVYLKAITIVPDLSPGIYVIKIKGSVSFKPQRLYVK